MAKIICPYCKKKVDYQAVICPYCNKELEPVPYWKTNSGVLTIFIGVLFLVGLLGSMYEKAAIKKVNPGERYDWGTYLTKKQCDQWKDIGSRYGESDRLNRIYDRSGKKRVATASIEIDNPFLPEAWTCFEIGYDMAYYQRY